MRFRHNLALDDQGRVHLRIRKIVGTKKENPAGELLLHTSGWTKREAIDAAMIALMHEQLRRIDGDDHTCALCAENELTPTP